MTLVHIENIKIAGISACVPDNIIHNVDYNLISEEERNAFIKLTGIHKRHVASDRITPSDMCFIAAENLLRELDIPAKDIGFLIFVSQSRDYYLPHTSAILHDRLGLSQSTPAFDISLGCSGYPYALSVISSLMNHSNKEYGLLLAGDMPTKASPITDKSTYPLFGDAGTATVLKKTAQSSPSWFSYGNDGGRHEAIIIRNGCFRNGCPPESFEPKEISPGISRSKMDVEMNGADIFMFSITDVPVSIKKFLKTTGFNNKDFDYFVLHQANKKIIDTISKILKIDPEIVPQNLDRFGNTSVASIPLCMVTELKNELQTKKLRLFLSGFGVGLSWGNAIIETDHIHVCDLQYIDI